MTESVARIIKNVQSNVIINKQRESATNILKIII